PRYNIAPSDLHFIVREERRGRIILPARWGLTGKRKPLIINVRSETAEDRFGAAFRDRRCVGPGGGFYEGTGTGKKKHPVWYHRPDRGLLLLAGLFEERPDGETSFTVLTTAPNQLAAQIHDRMPVILTPEMMKEWLTAPSFGLLKPAPENLL